MRVCVSSASHLFCLRSALLQHVTKSFILLRTRYVLCASPTAFFALQLHVMVALVRALMVCVRDVSRMNLYHQSAEARRV